MTRGPGMVLILALVGLMGTFGCASWRGGPKAEEEGARLAAALVDSVSSELAAGAVAWLGVRDDAGGQSGGAEALDEHLLSALLRAGTQVTWVDTAGRKWGGTGALPAARWRAVRAPLAVGARLRLAGAWAYVRLLVVDTRSGRLLATADGRLPQDRLQQLAARTWRHGSVAATDGRLTLRLQVLVVRTETGITRQLEFREGAQLLAGDRLQARMSVSSDCELYAFLYDSEGNRREVLGAQFVYSQRTQYGPGEEEWLTLRGPDRVYTLYVIAARHLAEDRTELWEQMAELVEQGRVDHWVGLSLQDRLLRDYVQRQQEGDSTRVVVRGAEGVRQAAAEEVILSDGSRLRSRPEIIEGGDMVIRAVSFVVQ